ncbi:hypothetical protein [Allokutzneria sp. NRRL B-24872]|uniref:hypothetical protein n=1 Tax=Allokutzneria sp. NRRL B-24872 TaxID=1137961 RepID=UPI000A363084|nr:hypothetical protein [Allokutzneria sp. NRRL B-24872]
MPERADAFAKETGGTASAPQRSRTQVAQGTADAAVTTIDVAIPGGKCMPPSMRITAVAAFLNANTASVLLIESEQQIPKDLSEKVISTARSALTTR